MADDQALITDLQGRIDRENKYIQGAMQMRASTDNPSIQAQADNTIREGRRNIGYFQSRLNELQMRRMNQGVQGMSLDPRKQQQQQQQQQLNNGGVRPPISAAARGSSSAATAAAAAAAQTSYQAGPTQDHYYPHPGYEGDEAADYGDGGYSDINSQRPGPPRGPFAPGPPGSPRARPTYSRLDLIKYDTPHLGPKIQLMLSQLEFKLSVEKQYRDGIKKIMGSYKIDGDRKVRKEAEGRHIESVQKIELLKRALKRYEDLHVDMESSTDLSDDDSLNTPSLRKPLTGSLSLRIHAVSDVPHAQSTSLFGSSRAPDTFVIMKVEDDFKGRTKATRTDRWTDEMHEIDIDKGNEIELTVYDKSGGDHPLPIGMLWIRISDIVEEMRRKKIETGLQSQGWVSADKTIDDSRSQARPDLQFSPPPGSSQMLSSPPMGQQQQFGGPGQPQTGPVWIESWFQLEPVGRIQISMSFTKQTRERRNFDAGLNRKGAIRQRKEDIHELHGHKFVSQQFYNIMRCALCGELLKYATGMQCTDCKYMCHEKCYPQVVTKCISKSNAESDPDEARINHRIPHRFEAWGNISANWCCHCGYLLPIGRKNCRRCRECKLTAHVHCTHLVPDFCGMPMKEANRILMEMKNAATKRQTMSASPSLRPNPPKPRAPRAPPSYMTPGGGSVDLASKAEDRLSVETSDRFSTPQTGLKPGSSLLDPAGDPSAYGGTGSGTASGPLGTATRPETQRRPVGGGRSESSSTAVAAAAAAALASTRPPPEARPYPPRAASSQTLPSARTQAPTPGHTPYDPRAYAEVDQPYRAGPQPVAPTTAVTTGAAATPAYTPQQPSVTVSAPAAAPSAAPAPLGPASTFNEQPRQTAVSKPQGSGRRIGLDHFNFLAVLGKGNFGKVMLAETKASKQLYAIKVLKKEFIIENDEVESTRSERDVFIIANKARHPFLLNLHACFQTETRVYFVMEYISGGDLMWHIQRGQFGAKRAQFYAAEVCLALKYFHENGVVYRDLKLDNILLTLDGHIKIADYGLCKKDMYYGSTTRTFCGTPEFMAPEILLDKPYGRAVDWWAFGVLIYQMLLQQSPFRGEDEDEIYDAILADEPLYPIHMPRDSVSILQKLLTREPELRLGSGPTDAQEIMSHSFFRTVNWDEIQAKRVPSPFMPQIKNATDTSNFDSEFTSVTPVLTPVQSVLSQAMQEEFRGFSYSADFV